MEVEFSKDAQDQLKIRSRITKPMILEVLRSSDDVSRSYRDRELYRKQYGKEILEVGCKRG